MDENQKHFYANSVNIAAGLYDISFLFRSQSPQIDDTGQVNMINGQPSIVVNEEIIVRMSPQHAKALASILVDNIIEYEKQFNISLPLVPELQAKWDKQIIKK